MNLQNASTSLMCVLFLICAPFGQVNSLFSEEDVKKATIDPEDTEDMPHLSPHPDNHLDLGAEDFDQKAFAGSAEFAKTIVDMDYEEKVKALTSLFGKIDVDISKTISVTELEKWVLNSIKTLKEEDAASRFKDHDYDNDGKFSWADHLYSQYGFVPTKEEIEKGVPGAEADEEDHKFQLDLFKLCDTDKNNELSIEEFQAFYRPEDFKHTQDMQTTSILRHSDTNKDGSLDLKEFLKAELHEDDPKDWIVIETERFLTNWDTNKDGVLKGDEIRAWQMPSNEEVAKEETVHLFGVADENKDSLLDLDEIIKHHETFGGSQATNYGQHLVDEL